MQTVITPFPNPQALAGGSQTPGAEPGTSRNQSRRDASTPPDVHPAFAERNDALVLDLAAARLELLAHEAEADARQFNTMRELSAAAGCRLEADALRLAGRYLRDCRAGLPDWLEGVHVPGDFIAFRPSHGIARTVASFRPACEVLIDLACGLTEQAADAESSDKVIAGGYRAESTALRFAAAVLSQEQPATAADLAA